MKKTFVISMLVVVALIGAAIWRVSLRKGMPIPMQIPTPTAVNPQRDEVLDLSSYPPGTSVSRWGLLNEMANRSENDPDTFLLDDNDPSTKVAIGTYSTSYKDGKSYPGGIIMLKRLPDGKDSIYWEITSPLLDGGPSPIQLVKDINNDGFKEIVTLWGGVIDDLSQYSYWIFTFDLHTKTYKVLNMIIDKDKNVQHDFDFEHPDLKKTYNRFDTDSGYHGIDKVIKDIDGDGVAEIIMHDPSLERFGIVYYPPDIGKKFTIDQTRGFTQTYKWNGKEYYLWKEEIQKQNN